MKAIVNQSTFPSKPFFRKKIRVSALSTKTIETENRNIKTEYKSEKI